MDFVVPVAVEPVAAELDLREFLVGDFEAGLIGFRIQFGMDSEAGGGGRGGDEADNSFETSQRFPAPVLADVREEPVWWMRRRRLVRRHTRRQ